MTDRKKLRVKGLLSGQSPPTPLLQSMRTPGSTRFLLIAGGGIHLEVAFNELFLATVRELAA